MVFTGYSKPDDFFVDLTLGWLANRKQQMSENIETLRIFSYTLYLYNTIYFIFLVSLGSDIKGELSFFDYNKFYNTQVFSRNNDV